MDDEIVILAAAIYRDRVRDARKESTAKKFLDSGDLFDYASEINKAGIRSQNPEYTEAQVMQEFRRRLKIGRLIEMHPIELP